MQQVRYLTGTTLKKMILAGGHKVIEAQDELNEINVFPVPDGDTGSNMAALFESINQQLNSTQTDTINDIAQQAADAALNGARGNSGSIFAQFFQGIDDSLQQSDSVDLERFSSAMVDAARASYDAISEPVEGTIITVMREWAEAIQQNRDQCYHLSELLHTSLKSAQSALGDTSQQLAILSDNHVVDAGAKGFVSFVEGMTEYIRHHTVHPDEDYIQDEHETNTDNQQADTSSDETSQTQLPELHLTPHAAHSNEDLHNQYCTECIIQGQDLDIKVIKEQLSQWGDSFVIVGNKRKVKVHIHTNSPTRVFRDANIYGEVLETKADDMWAQYRAKIGWYVNKKIALVTDSSCNLPQELLAKYNIIILPLQVVINQHSYLDKVNLSTQDFFQYLNDQADISTSQPAPADIKNTFNKATEQSPYTLGIFLSGQLSGTYRNIKQMVKKITDEGEVFLFDSKNIACGLGLIVQETAKSIRAGKPLSTIKLEIKSHINNTTTLVSLNTLKYAIRGGRVKKSVGTIARALRLLPILKLDQKGYADKAGLTFGSLANRRKLASKAIKVANQYRHPKFMIAHANCIKEAKRLRHRIQKHYPEAHIDIVETTAALTAHAGPKSLAISILGHS